MRERKAFTREDAEKALQNGNSRVVIPSDCAYIHHDAFQGRKDLLHIELPPDIFILPEAFKDCGLHDVIIPKGANVKLMAFAGCGNLRNVFVSSGAEIDQCVFFGCCNLETIVYSKGAKYKEDTVRKFDVRLQPSDFSPRALIRADRRGTATCPGMGIFLEHLQQADESLLEGYLEELLSQGLGEWLQQYWRHLLLNTPVYLERFAAHAGKFSSPVVLGWLNGYLGIPVKEFMEYNQHIEPEMPELVRQGMKAVENVLTDFVSDNNKAFVSALRKGGFFNTQRTNEEKSVDGAMLSSYSGMKQ